MGESVMPSPYYEDAQVTLYHGDCREVLPVLENEVDLVVTDPPYGETSLEWDHWPAGWPSLVPGAAMWCFGSMRMFLDRASEFAGWKFAQDIVWKKNHAGFTTPDRFPRVHEHVLHWYRGDWGLSYHEQQREAWLGPKRGAATRGASDPSWTGVRGSTKWVDDGTRGVSSVIDVRSMHRRSIHPTEKPLGILDPLIRYGCPDNGTVLDPFAGSGSTLDAARAIGRSAVGIEAREDYCEAIANRLSQGDLFGGVA